MYQTETGARLRIFLGEDDEYHDSPLYQEIVVKAREAKLSGATVFRGIMGYGKTTGLHAAKFLGQARDLPVVVEIHDSEHKVRAFLKMLEPFLGGGIATIEKVEIHHYGKPALVHKD